MAASNFNTDTTAATTQAAASVTPSFSTEYTDTDRHCPTDR